jgi:hypothetical protein
MLFYMIRDKKLFAQVRDEIKKVVVDPYINANPGKPFDMHQALNFENMFDLKLYGNCFNESLRIEPSLP